MNDLPNSHSNTGTAAMYADDTTVTFGDGDTASLEFHINKELVNLENWLLSSNLPIANDFLTLSLSTQRFVRRKTILSCQIKLF